MRGPGEVNMDLGLTREFRFKERHTIQFRAESFNFTNTPHFANPGGNVSNLVKSGDAVKDLAGFAQVQSVANTGRDGIEQQFRSGPDMELVRPARALEVLERIGTADAKAIVQAVAGGRADAPLTLEARRVLARMK